jgi:ankyrin repeat protein
VQELGGFSPLMLACVSEKSNLETVKVLLSAGASFTTRSPDDQNILHLTARFGLTEVLEYLVKNLPSDYLFERNQKGETPLMICQQNKNQKSIQLLEALELQYDKSNKKAHDLLDFLEAEEEKEKREKAKKKEKKYRAKVAKIALKTGVSVQTVEEQKREEREKKIRDEENAEKARQLREQQEEQARLDAIE